MFKYTFYRNKQSSPLSLSFKWKDINWVRHEFGDLYFKINITDHGTLYCRGEFQEMEDEYIAYIDKQKYGEIDSLIEMINYN